MRPKTLDVACGLTVLAAAGIGVLRFAGGSMAERGPEGALAALALALVLAGPALAALLAYRHAPRVLIGAGVVLALAALTMSIATWPLLIPAVTIIAVGARRRGRGALAAVAVVGLVVAAFVVLFAFEDPRAWSGRGESGSISDVITYRESLASLALSGAALAVARWPALSRRGRPASSPAPPGTPAPPAPRSGPAAR